MKKFDRIIVKPVKESRWIGPEVIEVKDYYTGETVVLDLSALQDFPEALNTMVRRAHKKVRAIEEKRRWENEY